MQAEPGWTDKTDWKISRGQKHKPKWVTHDIIDAAITITDVELCAIWAPLSIVCGSGWFLDESVKSKMVSFVPLMKKQSFWMISRFVRALILTNELGEDLSVDARQDIFLYSSKMGILPGFPTTNGGWPSCTAEWMTIAPYFRDAIGTDEMKAFMTRYGYKTKQMVDEEVHKVKDLEEKRVSENLKKEAEAREAREAREAEERHNLEAERKGEEGHVEIVGEKVYMVAADVKSEIDKSEGDDIMMDMDMPELEEVGTNIGMSGEEIQGLIKSVEGIQKGTDTQVTRLEVVEMPRVIKTEVVEGEELSDSSSYNSGMESSCNSEESGDDEDNSEDDFGKRDFATSMRVEAKAEMMEEQYKVGQNDDEKFKERLEEVRNILRLAGVRR